MTFLPFPVVPYKIVHTGDIVLLLTLGFVYELFIRIYQYHAERRSSYERKLIIHVATLKYETAKKRALGPSAFVETSKLERAILTSEKELSKLGEERENRKTRAMKFIRKCNIATNALVVLVYWGVAMVVIDGSRLETDVESSYYENEVITDHERASAFWKGFLFPLSYNGMSYKIAQFGIDSSMRPCCLGALAVYWSARVTSGEIIECAIQWAS